MPTSLPRSPRRRPRHVGVLGTLACALVLTLAACSGSGDGGDESAGASRADVATDAGGSVEEVAPGTADAEATDQDDQADREIITTGNATLVAEDPPAAASRLARLVAEAGGRVESRSEHPGTDDEAGWASVTFRVPAERMTSAVDALDGLGDVQDVSIESDDVTSQGQDLDARIAALTTSTDRLRDLMASAGSTEELLQVEQELSTRQADLDALAAQREHLSDQVAMSTLSVEIVAEPQAVAQSQGGFLGGLASGWAALVTTLQTVVLVVGVLLPWLALGGLGFLAYRWLRRRTRKPATTGGDGPGSTGPGDGHEPSDDQGGPDTEGAAPEDAPVPVGR